MAVGDASVCEGTCRGSRGRGQGEEDVGGIGVGAIGEGL